MGSPPEGMLQLLQLGQVIIKREWSWCTPEYFIQGPDESPLFKTKGVYNFKLRNMRGDVVAEMHRSQQFGHMPRMTMTISHSGTPPLVIKPIGTFTRCFVIQEENKVILLKIKPIIQLSMYPEYEIWAVDPNNGEKTLLIGNIKVKWMKIKISFPPDLEIRCKTALIAASIFLEILRSK